MLQITKNLFFILALIVAPSVFSAPVPVVAGPFSTWYSPATVAIYEGAGLSVPLPVTTGGSVSLPRGSSTPYTAQLNTAGAATLQTTLPVSVVPPAGSVPTAAQSSSALALAGAGGIAATTLVADIPLGSGASSLAAKLALPALGFVAAAGGAAGMVLGSPALLAGAAAAGVGMAGYSLYQAIVGQGVSVNSSGVPVFTASSDLSSAYSSYCLNGYSNCFSSLSAVKVAAGVATSSLSPVVVYSDVMGTTGAPFLEHFVVYGCNAVCNAVTGWADIFVPSSAVVSVPVSVPASDIQIQNAIVNAVSTSALAVDAAKLAVQNGVDIQAAVVAAGVQANINALHLESAFSKLSSSVDTLGNTTAQLQRNIVDIPASPACINSGGCAPVVNTQTVPLINNLPQTVTTVSQAPAIAGAVAAATAAAAKTQIDLCEAHPDALACSNDSNLSDVSLVPLTTKNLAVTLTPVSVSAIASCPAPLTIGGGKIFIFDGVCTWASMLKPLILAFAWLCAGAVVFRGRPYA